MTDLAIKSNVVSGTIGVNGIAGESINAGQPVAVMGKDVVLAGAASGEGVGDPRRRVVGIALNTAAAGQPVSYAKPGSVVELGPILSAGTAYYLSKNAGGICVAGKIGKGMTPVILGIAISETQLKFAVIDAGIEL